MSRNSVVLPALPRPQKRARALQAAGCLDTHVPETGSTEAYNLFLFELSQAHT